MSILKAEVATRACPALFVNVNAAGEGNIRLICTVVSIVSETCVTPDKQHLSYHPNENRDLQGERMARYRLICSTIAALLYFRRSSLNRLICLKVIILQPLIHYIA